MIRGFNKNVEVEFELQRADIDKLLKEYKIIKKYQKSSMYAIKSIDGTEKIVSSLIREAEENPID